MSAPKLSPVVAALLIGSLATEAALSGNPMAAGYTRQDLRDAATFLRLLFNLAEAADGHKMEIELALRMPAQRPEGRRR